MLIKTYKDLHQIPELAFEEVKTKKYIIDILETNNISYENYNSGLIAKIVVDENKPYIAFRSELDALNINECNDIDFSSNNENMHACGHDMHISTILGICLQANENKERLENNVLFIFQSGEESGGGASKLISEVKWPNIKELYAFHNSNIIGPNQIGLQLGQINSHIIDFDITLKGKSAHVAQPYLGIDALNCGINFINLVKANMSVNFGAHKQVIINFSNVNTNNDNNRICDNCKITGTIRIGSLDIVSNVKTYFNKYLEDITKLNNVDYDVNFYELKALINDQNLHEKLINMKPNFVTYKNVSSGGDDFANFSELGPIYLIKLGSMWEHGEFENCPVHSSNFLPNYNGITYGVEIGCKILNLK